MITWTNGTPEDVFMAGFTRYQQALRLELMRIASFYSPQIQSWMREEAKWTDRTGNARQGLVADPQALENEIVIYLHHSVDYGIWIEVAHAGEWAILTPALDTWGPILFDAVKALVS